MFLTYICLNRKLPLHCDVRKLNCPKGWSAISTQICANAGGSVVKGAVWAVFVSISGINKKKITQQSDSLIGE